MYLTSIIVEVYFLKKHPRSQTAPRTHSDLSQKVGHFFQPYIYAEGACEPSETVIETTEEQRAQVIHTFTKLELHIGALIAFHKLQSNGWRLIALTNGGDYQTVDSRKRLYSGGS